MKRREWLTVLGVAALLLTSFLLSRPAISFARLEDACMRIRLAGFHCTGDAADGRMMQGFLVSRERVSLDGVNALCKTGKMGPAWQGKVWIAWNTPNWTLCTVPDDAGTLHWGHVTAFGDRQFLEELENKLRTPRYRLLG